MQDKESGIVLKLHNHCFYLREESLCIGMLEDSLQSTVLKIIARGKARDKLREGRTGLQKADTNWSCSTPGSLRSVL